MTSAGTTRQNNNAGDHDANDDEAATTRVQIKEVGARPGPSAVSLYAGTAMPCFAPEATAGGVCGPVLTIWTG